MITKRYKVRVDSVKDVADFKSAVLEVYDQGDFSIEVEVYDEYERFVGYRTLRRCNITKGAFGDLVDKMVFVDPSDKKYDVYMDYRLN